MFTCIDEIPAEELRGKRVLVRAGFDVPLTESGEVADFFRVRRSAETIKYLSAAGAHTIILSHIGRDAAATNEPVSRALQHHVPHLYIPEIDGHAARNAIQVMQDGEVILLENLRQDPREVANDDEFAKELASLGELYVGDAFSAAHRAHTSVVGVPKYLPHYAGLLMRDEVVELKKARVPDHPSFAILGGAKFETKAPLIKALLGSYDNLFVTGALANDVYKAQGFPIGRSLISKELPTPYILAHPHFLSPCDVTVQQADGHAFVKKPDAVDADDKIVDIGPDSVRLIAPFLEKANFILWNGPTGLYEEGFAAYTHAIAEIIARRVDEGAHAVVGGGDTIAAILESGVPEDRLGFLSTGGGAMLEYLLKGSLPGIDALTQGTLV
ncbi:MAG: phosphoglycerate kinase [Minisyncoccia bacterium]